MSHHQPPLNSHTPLLSVIARSTSSSSTASYHSIDHDDTDELTDHHWNSWSATSQQYKRAVMTHAQNNNSGSHKQQGEYQPIDKRIDVGHVNDSNETTFLDDTHNTTSSLSSTPTKLHVQHTATTHRFELLPSGSVRASVFNLSSATLGAGALAIPYAFQSSGLLVGLTLLVGAYALSCYSISLLIQSSIITKQQSYETMAHKLFSHRALSLCVDINILLFCFGTCVAYLVGTADIITPIMTQNFGFAADSILGNRTAILVMFTVCIMFPLSCCQQINQLRFSSFIGVLTLLFLVFSIMYRAVQYTLLNGLQYSRMKFVDDSAGYTGTIVTLSIIMYAFTCQPNVFSIYTELLDSTPRTMSKVVSRSFLLSSTVYLLIGVSGWLHYAGNIQSDILRNIDTSTDLLMGVAQLGLGIAITLAYPLNVFPARHSIQHMLWPTAPEPAAKQHEDSDVESDDQQVSALVFYGLTVLIVGSSLALAVYTTNLSSVFAIIGSTTSAVVCFILPPVFYLCCTTESLSSWVCIKAWCLLIAGVLMGCIATATTVINILT